jgi:glycosyltransferase involved in cell wall biosynthesis
MRRIAILTNRIPPYRLPVYEALLREEPGKYRFFLSDPLGRSDPRVPEVLPVVHSAGIDFMGRVVHRAARTVQEETVHVPVRLPPALMRFRPDLLISGEFGLRSIAALAVARRLGVPLALSSEEIDETGKAVSLARRLLRRMLLPRADAFLAWGIPAADYLLGRGIPPDRVYLCAQAVDHASWSRMAGRVDRERFRSDRGLKGRVFLAAGRLVARKGFDWFLRAWAALPQEARGRHSVAIVGGGEERERLRAIARESGLPDVVFGGPCDREELAGWYAAADVFVFPSLVDVWGLVVNEAMACGLPVLASNRAGASRGLVEGSGAGELFDPLDRERFTFLLLRWAESPPPFSPDDARRAASRHDFGETVSAFRRCIADLSRRGGRA